MTNAESSAEEIVTDFGLTLPIIPAELCRKISTDDYPIEYVEKKFSSNDFLGISIGDGTGAQILVNQGIEYQGRKHFTGAHEIGHVVLHIQTAKQSEFRCSESDIYGSGGENNQDFEREANEFASSLLMPQSLIGNTIDRNDLSWRLIQRIMKDCNASLEASARRVIALSKEMCALIIHKDGEMWVPVRSSSLNQFIDRVPFPSYLNTSPDRPDIELPDRLEECDTTDWITNNRNLPDRIQYSSIYNEEFDRIMTLILAREIDEIDDEDAEWEEPSFR